MTHPGPKQYLLVFTALMLFTAATVWAAYQDFGLLNTIVALAIAGIKAALVIAIFMHVRWSERLVAVFSVAGFVWLGILVVVVYSDIATR
jgi:cytochrome c oxidase subunit 4